MDYVLQESTKMYSDGKRHFYPKTTSCHVINLQDIDRYANFFMPGSLAASAAIMRDGISKFLRVGHSVKIEGLGVFSPSLKFADEETGAVDAVTDKEVIKLFKNKTAVLSSVNFKIDADWRREITENLYMQKVGFKFARKIATTLEERNAVTRAYLLRYGYLTNQVYANIHHMSISAAQKETEMLKRDERYGFSKGCGGHLVLA